MSLSVTHTFVSGIADDPASAAAGDVLPSHWNSTHTISGTLPAANVSPAGSNTDVQFNNSGALAGDANFTYTTPGVITLTATGQFQVPTITLTDSIGTAIIDTDSQGSIQLKANSSNSGAINVLNPTGTSPSIGVLLTTDNFRRVIFGLDGSDNPFFGFGPGSSTRDVFLKRLGSPGVLSITTGTAWPAQTTQTANYSQLATDRTIIFNGSGSITLTMLAASTYSGLELWVKNIASQTVVSASANIIPANGSTASTSILAATPGKFALLKSNGTNWEIIASN